MNTYKKKLQIYKLNNKQIITILKITQRYIKKTIMLVEVDG